MTASPPTCGKCGYEYVADDGDPEAGVSPGTAWEDLPNDWFCPNCGAPKYLFE